MNYEEKIKLKRFCEEIIENPRMLDCQPHKRDGKHIWCEDWEIIEILKYLFLGKEAYMGDTPPNRLKNNHLWSKAEIETKAEMLKAKPVAQIISQLRNLRNGTASGLS